MIIKSQIQHWDRNSVTSVCTKKPYSVFRLAIEIPMTIAIVLARSQRCGSNLSNNSSVLSACMFWKCPETERFWDIVNEVR